VIAHNRTYVEDEDDAGRRRFTWYTVWGDGEKGCTYRTKSFKTMDEVREFITEDGHVVRVDKNVRTIVFLRPGE
jgi:hypothetical protein